MMQWRTFLACWKSLCVSDRRLYRLSLAYPSGSVLKSIAQVCPWRWTHIARVSLTSVGTGRVTHCPYHPQETPGTSLPVTCCRSHPASKVGWRKVTLAREGRSKHLHKRQAFLNTGCDILSLRLHMFRKICYHYLSLFCWWQRFFIDEFSLFFKLQRSEDGEVREMCDDWCVDHFLCTLQLHGLGLIISRLHVSVTLEPFNWA